MSGKRYAILIASSSFPEEPGLTELRCPKNDVAALNEILSSPEHGQFTETFVLKNKPSHEVLEQIEAVLHDAGREDLVLIYFSGHGKLNPAGQLCLATANTKLKKLGSTSIPVERIKSFFDAADTRKKILILDCCYSGAAGAEFVKGGVDDQLQLMSGGQGTFIMTASTGFQTAVEKKDDQLGLFTKHLIDGIRSGEADRDEDGLVDIHELYQHVHEKVRAEGAQEPMKWDINAKGRMIVARSGNALQERRRKEIECSLHRLAADRLLTSKIVHEAVRVLHVPKKTLNSRERQHVVLIEQLYGSRICTADFIEQWMEVRFSGAATEQNEHKAVPKAESKRDAPVIYLERPAYSLPKKGDVMRDKITGIEMVYIPAGCFMMGSDDSSDERPVHEVCVDAFWLGKYPVTQEQWQKIMGSNPSKFQKGYMYPVEQVSWNDVQKFLATLNKQSGKKHRLPTEAEWEYACRAGGSGKYDLDAVAWYDKNSGGGTHSVGEKQANSFGLHDMLGNVWEWCADWYDPDYYAYSLKDNPTGPKPGSYHVIRGGGWYDSSECVRTAIRDRCALGNNCGSHLGFRLVLPFQAGGG